MFVKDLSKANAPFVTIVNAYEKDYALVDNIAEKLLVLTNHNAPNQRLILVNPEKPEEANWETLVPEDPADVLQSAVICGGKIVCSYLHLSLIHI